MREHASWDPTAYGRFASERSRPFADLARPGAQLTNPSSSSTSAAATAPRR